MDCFADFTIGRGLRPASHTQNIDAPSGSDRGNALVFYPTS
jgi:hypothetical protein